MTEQASSDAPANPIFTVRMSPHRSLSLRGFNILMACIGLVSFICGVAFLTMGAWPVFGFFGLDAALVYIAFRRNYMDARAFEQIDIFRERLLVRQVSARGKAVEHDFHPYWTRLVVDRRSWGIAGLLLTSSGRRLAIGGFLAPEDRASFADAMSRALSIARSAPVPA